MPEDTELQDLVAAAQKYSLSDPPAALVKLRIYAEMLADKAAQSHNLFRFDGETADEFLGRLESRGVFSKEVAELFHDIRKLGNAAAHENEGTREDARRAIAYAEQLKKWFENQHGKFSQSGANGSGLSTGKKSQRSVLTAADKLASRAKSGEAAFNKSAQFELPKARPLPWGRRIFTTGLVAATAWFIATRFIWPEEQATPVAIVSEPPSTLNTTTVSVTGAPANLANAPAQSAPVVVPPPPVAAPPMTGGYATGSVTQRPARAKAPVSAAPTFTSAQIYEEDRNIESAVTMALRSAETARARSYEAQSAVLSADTEMDRASKAARSARNSFGTRYFGLRYNVYQRQVGSISFEYAGETGNQIADGVGVVTWSNGQIYRGQMSAEKMNGDGVYSFPTGEIFRGRYFQNQRVLGVYKNRVGEVQEGQFRGSLFHGHGVEILSSGQRYEGQFQNGRREGYGAVFFGPANSYKWVGEFKGGAAQGYGQYIAGKTVRSGRFERTSTRLWISGYGKQHDDAGNLVHRGLFRDGAFVGPEIR